jgi:hypothetical protein
VNVQLTLDHLVYGVPDLNEAIEDFEKRLGLAPRLGGRHGGLGTHNAILPLEGESYIELIASDPDGPTPNQPRPFGLDTLCEPRLVTWAVRSRAIETDVQHAREQGFDPGIVFTMSRTEPEGETLEWKLSLLPKPFGDGLVPFVIDWGKSRHPAAAPRSPSEDQTHDPADDPTKDDPTSHGKLSAFSATHPNPAPIRAALHALGVALDVKPGTIACLNVRLTGPAGSIELNGAG